MPPTQQTRDAQDLMGQNRAGKNPVISYPYNSIADIEIVENIDTKGPNYKALVEGTAYPDATNYPDHVLIFQEPIDQQYLKRTYLNIAAVSWHEQESIGMTYPEIFGSYAFLDPIGNSELFIAARSRTVLAHSVYTLTIGQDTSTTQSDLWNPITNSWKLWYGFTARDVLNDAFTYSGTVQGTAFTQFVPASNPSATAYIALVAANTFVLYQFESKRWRQNIYASKRMYVPLL